MLALLRAPLVVFAALTGVTGVVYPLLVTGIAHVAFQSEAEGSLVRIDGRVVGSALLGQPWEEPKYLWGRLSATTPYPYNAGSSAASNVGPSNPALADAAKGRLVALRDAFAETTGPVPIDLVTSSGSGLDPDISVAAARYQVARIARVRHVPETVVQKAVDEATTGPSLGVFGEPRVNVLAVNLALDRAP